MPNGTWEKFIKYKDLEYAMNGNYKIKSYKLEGERKYRAFYIINDSNKTLGTISYHSSSGMISGGTTHYNYYIIENNTLIKTGRLPIHNKEKYIAHQLEFSNDLKTHFEDCDALMTKLNEIETDYSIDGVVQDTSFIFNFFLKPIYIKNCN